MHANALFIKCFGQEVFRNKAPRSRVSQQSDHSNLFAFLTKIIILMLGPFLFLMLDTASPKKKKSQVKRTRHIDEKLNKLCLLY
jgi:hypothetical protein